MTSPSTTRTLRRAPASRFAWLAALALLIGGALALYNIIRTRSPIAGPVSGGLSDAELAQAFFTSPDVANLALFLLALAAATLGGAWFVIRLLHWRFRPEAELARVWRQSLWVALCVAAGAWLQLSRALTLALAALIAGAFVLLEVYLNAREQQE